MVVELGANFNQVRFIDPVHLALERDPRAGWMLYELVFMHQQTGVPPTRLRSRAFLLPMPSSR